MLIYCSSKLKEIIKWIKNEKKQKINLYLNILEENMKEYKKIMNKMDILTEINGIWITVQNIISSNGLWI